MKYDDIAACLKNSFSAKWRCSSPLNCLASQTIVSFIYQMYISSTESRGGRMQSHQTTLLDNGSFQLLINQFRLARSTKKSILFLATDVLGCYLHNYLLRPVAPHDVFSHAQLIYNVSCPGRSFPVVSSSAPFAWCLPQGTSPGVFRSPPLSLALTVPRQSMPRNVTIGLSKCVSKASPSSRKNFHLNLNLDCSLPEVRVADFVHPPYSHYLGVLRDV